MNPSAFPKSSIENLLSFCCFAAVHVAAPGRAVVFPAHEVPGALAVVVTVPQPQVAGGRVGAAFPTIQTWVTVVIVP